MIAKRIIPCLDVKDGRVVKGTNFLNLKDAGDPVEIAALYDKEGADELTFLDITASYENRDIILDVVQKTAEQVFMPLTVGGGIRNIDDIRRLLNAGADKVSINTAAVKDPEFVTKASDGLAANVSWSLLTQKGQKAMLPMHSGKFIYMVVERPPGWMLLHGQRRLKQKAPVKYY